MDTLHFVPGAPQEHRDTPSHRSGRKQAGRLPANLLRSPGAGRHPRRTQGLNACWGTFPGHPLHSLGEL